MYNYKYNENIELQKGDLGTWKYWNCTFEMLKCSCCYASPNQWLTCCFADRGEQVSMGHFIAF